MYKIVSDKNKNTFQTFENSLHKNKKKFSNSSQWNKTISDWIESMRITGCLEMWCSVCERIVKIREYQDHIHEND
jgi:hypothetical protein